MENGLRIKSLLIKDQETIICDYEFIDRIGKNENPFETIIIGSNGTGKSTVLRYITEIFNRAISGKNCRNLKHSFYKLEYYIDSDFATIVIEKKKVLLLLNDIKIKSKEDFKFPKKLLALAFMVNDKYYFQKNSEEEDCYKYLGIRGAANASWTSTISDKVAENVIYLAEHKNIKRFVENMSDFLNVDSRFVLTCELYENKKLGIKKYDEIYDYVEKKIEKIKEKESYRTDFANKLTTEDISKYTRFLDYYLKKKQEIKTKHDSIQLEFSLTTYFEDTFNLIEAYKILKDLKLLNILGNLTLYLSKGNELYSFDDSSSGEKHIIYIITSISRYIEDNSVILIDEPEISLHPEWQMKYMGFMRRLFTDYNSCHFLVATHSPYMVSDLIPGESSLVVMKMKENERKAELIDFDTYAWSVENILYDVFGTRTARNYFFEKDLSDLLDGVEVLGKDNIDEKKRLLNKLESYVFSDNDPLKEILLEVKRRIENVESK